MAFRVHYGKERVERFSRGSTSLLVVVEIGVDMIEEEMLTAHEPRLT